MCSCVCARLNSNVDEIALCEFNFQTYGVRAHIGHHMHSVEKEKNYHKTTKTRADVNVDSGTMTMSSTTTQNVLRNFSHKKRFYCEMFSKDFIIPLQLDPNKIQTELMCMCTSERSPSLAPPRSLSLHRPLSLSLSASLDSRLSCKIWRIFYDGMLTCTQHCSFAKTTANTFAACCSLLTHTHTSY